MPTRVLPGETWASIPAERPRLPRYPAIATSDKTLPLMGSCWADVVTCKGIAWNASAKYQLEAHEKVLAKSPTSSARWSWPDSRDAPNPRSSTASSAAA